MNERRILSEEFWHVQCKRPGCVLQVHFLNLITKCIDSNLYHIAYPLQYSKSFSQRVLYKFGVLLRRMPFPVCMLNISKKKKKKVSLQVYCAKNRRLKLDFRV